ncbi:hypothetical protein D3C85_1178990 [compost metagenome]
MSGFQPGVVLGKLVREPGNTQRGMPQHRGRHTRFLNHAIFKKQSANPAQINIHRPHRPAAQHDAGAGRVIGNVVHDAARILAAPVDQFQRGHHVIRGIQHVEQADVRALQRLAQHKRQFDFHARHDQLVGGNGLPILIEHRV